MDCNRTPVASAPVVETAPEAGLKAMDCPSLARPWPAPAVSETLAALPVVAPRVKAPPPPPPPMDWARTPIALSPPVATEPVLLSKTAPPAPPPDPCPPTVAEIRLS